jgi:hypothetical protein
MLCTFDYFYTLKYNSTAYSMPYATCNPLPKFWVPRLGKDTPILLLGCLSILRCLASLLCSGSFFAPPMCQLVLLPIIYQNHQHSGQSNNDKAFKNPVINSVFVKTINISPWHWIGFGEIIIVIVVITIIQVIVTEEIADPF